MPQDWFEFTISSNLKLPKLTEEQVLKNIEKATLESLSSNVEISLQELKKEATIFLASIQTLDEDYAAFTKASLNKIITALPESTSYLNNTQITKERLYTQSLYMLAFRFDEFLSRFRKEDKERKVLYVSESVDSKTGKVKELKSYPMSYKELVINADKHGRIGDISKKRLTIDNRLSIEEQGIIPQEHINEARSAYEAVNNRLNRYFKKHNTGQKQSGLLMWKENAQWVVGSVLNKGDLKEAYTNFLFQQHNKNDIAMCKKAASPGQPNYYNDSMVRVFYNNYIQKVTNLPAIVEEDVITTDAQYGVKGKKAALPSLQQYIDTATIVLQGGINQKNVEEIIKNQYNVNAARNIKMTLEDGYIDIAELTAKEFVDMAKKVNKNKT